jgi:predicted phage terminase large subunit-like protein
MNASSNSPLEILLKKSEEDTLRRRCVDSFYTFTKHAWIHVDPKPYVDNWHIYILCEYLQNFAHTVMYDEETFPKVDECGEPIVPPEFTSISNLIVNIPPGHAKSLVASVLFPAWVWLTYPHAKFLCSSHAAVLSTRDSVRCRDLIRSEWYLKTFFPTWSIKKDQDEKTYYVNTAFGWRYSLGVGSNATGWRPNFHISDDLLDAKKAESENERKSVNEWYDTAMSTRLQDVRKGHLLIMQRLHEKDLAGHLLESRGDNYELLCLQAEYDPTALPTSANRLFNDPRNTHELLFPQIYDESSISLLKRALGSFNASAQLQQAPTPRAGGFIKRDWFKRYTFNQVSPLDFVEVLQSWDCAVKDKPQNDRAAVQIWGRIRDDHPIYPGKVCLYYAFADQMDIVDNIRKIRDVSKAYPFASTKLIEDKANGSPIITMLEKQLGDTAVIAFDPQSRSKEVRVSAVAPFIEDGNVIIPEDAEASWVSEFLEEVTKFNKHPKDDQVDAMTQALLHFTQDKPWVFSF